MFQILSGYLGKHLIVIHLEGYMVCMKMGHVFILILIRVLVVVHRVIVLSIY